ncbi:tubulin--tyrosine ligase-like protein 12 [Galendromus occidentalis]|uniref:Tubulin--tyrosine ligase-like protein 12 n=1 Tax=Galendromus occidentalis TaxID=34638 RepID=A0AAJ6QRW4_9ACAR|nr:tubulin--tyrosine ligase-like protein 12 [Galendromus occidentalis]
MGVPLDPEFLNFLTSHRTQLETSGVPEHFWSALYRKLCSETFDSGGTFSFARLQDDEGEESELVVVLSKPNGLRATDPEGIYLCDHAWTFRPDAAKTILECNGALRERLAALMDLASSDVDEVLPRIWRYAQTYSLGLTEIEDSLPVWYIVDELGSRISHSRSPNFRLVPLYHHKNKQTYSLLFPIEDIEENSVVTRNYIEGPPTDEETARALLLPWYDFDFRHIDFHQEEPDEEFFQGGRHLETMPGYKDGGDGEGPAMSFVRDRRLKVFTDYRVLQENLTRDGRYEVTTNFDEADIVWLNTHFKDFAEFQGECPEKMINQFPFEHILTVKDLFAVVSRRGAPKADDLTTYPQWIATTFNLRTELPKFVSYFQRRADANLDNHWIVKPFNLARSLDTYISENVEFITRVATTGPKIVCKYIVDPVLFNRAGVGKVKFDIRYCVLLRSVRPLKLWVHKKFYLRFANKPFSLDDFHVYEKHFTVMNYADDITMENMLCDEFVQEFEQQNDVRWENVEGKIFAALRELFQNAVKMAPPRGIGDSPQSRSMYAVDLMLEWDDGGIQPKLLELNWAPDCKRACEFYPTFFADVFDALFKDDLSSGNILELL